MNGFEKFANKCAEKVYKWFGQSSGKMLLAASMVGISMSSLIQACAVLFNDKYTLKQKAFMVPQELGDAALSMVSILAITRPTQKLMAKLVKTGKIMPKNLVGYMKENKLLEKRGSFDFDFPKEVRQILEKIEKSDRFVKASESGRIYMSGVHKSALDNFENFEDSSMAIATTMAGIVSTCVAVPLLRNNIASRYQRKSMDYINSNNTVQPAFKARQPLFRV